MIFKLILLTFLFSLSVPAFCAFKFEEDHSLPIIYLHIVLENGAANDPLTKLGLNHVSTNMLLRGTKKDTKNQFFDKLNDLGGTIDVDARSEGTIFRAAILSENLEPFLNLLTETFTEPRFDSEELGKLKKEVESEILEQQGNDKSLAVNHFNRFYYGNNGFGNPNTGTRGGVKTITSNDVKSFYSQHFGSKSLHFFGTGDAKKEQLEQWFAHLVSVLDEKNPHAAVYLLQSFNNLSKAKKALIVDKPNATQSQVLVGGKGIRPDFDGFYSVMLANHSFGGHSFQARLMQEIRVKRGWTYGASNIYKFGKQTRHFMMYYFPKTSDTVPAIKLSISLLEDYIKNGITRDEYAFAKESLVNNAPFNYDTPKKRLENTTAEFLTGFPDGFYRDFADNIQKVQYESIQPALQRAVDSQALTLTIVGDAKKLLPDVEKLDGFSKPKVVSYLED